jgi:hypothetical protein
MMLWTAPPPARECELVADELEGETDQDRRQGVSHGRYVAFQMAEVAIPRQMFQEILQSSRNYGCSRQT